MMYRIKNACKSDEGEGDVGRLLVQLSTILQSLNNKQIRLCNDAKI
jgi:hypothetical protein